MRNFHNVRNFRRLHYSSCEISFMLPLFILQDCSPFCHYSPLLLFHAFAFLLQFFVSSHFIPCNSFDFGSFCNFAWLGKYISSCTIIKENFMLSNKIGGKLSAFPLFLLFSPLSLIFSLFLGCQTPSKDDNLEDERIKPLLP